MIKTDLLAIKLRVFAFWCFFLVVTIIKAHPSNRVHSDFNRSMLLSFTENKGQFKDCAGNLRPDILFVGSKGNTRVYLRKTGISYVFNESSVQLSPKRIGKNIETNTDTANKIYKWYRLDMDFSNCNPDSKIITENAESSYSNYYLPQCPDGIMIAKSYQRVIYKDIYPDIDLVFYNDDHGMAYDFKIKKGGDPNDIKLKYNGADNLSISEKGNLNIAFPLGQITENAPKVYDENSKPLESSFVMNSDKETVSFHLSGFHNQPITIDPPVQWSTYIGGGRSDYISVLSVGKDNNVYGVGTTTSFDFPVTSGAFQSSLGSSSAINLVIVKFSPEGKLLWSTYFGGSGNDDGQFNYSEFKANGPGIATDGSDNVVVTSGTTSTDLPVTSGAYQTSFLGSNDAFIAKFNTDGKRLWATYYGDALNYVEGESVAIDEANNIYITGICNGIGTLQGSDSTYGYRATSISASFTRMYVAKFNPAGMRSWSFIYGGNKLPNGAVSNMITDYPSDVNVDDSNNVIIVGAYTSKNFPLTRIPQYPTNATGEPTVNICVLKFDSSGRRKWAISLGWNAWMVDVAADIHGNIYTVGWTWVSAVIKNAYQSTFGGFDDAFLGKFDLSGNLIWYTYLGGSGVDQGTGVTVDSAENVTICGVTNSGDFPIKNGIQKTYVGGAGDGFVAQFDKSCNLNWSTYYGGTGLDNPTDVEQDKNGNIYVSGLTESGDFPSKNAFQGSSNGGQDGFIFKLGNNTISDTNVTNDSNINHIVYFKVYPNLTPDILTIESETYGPVDYNYEVFDELGRVILKYDDSIHNGKYKKTISLEPYAAAMYILVTRVGTAVYTNKIIKSIRY